MGGHIDSGCRQLELEILFWLFRLVYKIFASLVKIDYDEKWKINKLFSKKALNEVVPIFVRWSDNVVRKC